MAQLRCPCKFRSGHTIALEIAAGIDECHGAGSSATMPLPDPFAQGLPPGLGQERRWLKQMRQGGHPAGSAPYPNAFAMGIMPR